MTNPTLHPFLVCYSVFATLWAVLATWDGWRQRRRPWNRAADRMAREMGRVDSLSTEKRVNINRILEKI